MKALDRVSRWIVGLLFVFSGFVKAIDPIGGAIKFSDYFQVLHLSAFKPVAIHLAILLSALEFLIGIHLLFNTRRKITSWLTLGFMLFFTFLTLYIALYNPVSDCGCFGDAVKLSNWETFIKNLVLIVPTIYIFINRDRFESQLSEGRQWSVTTFFATLILVVNIYGMAHLPLLDFRPFKVGNSIPEGMLIPEGAEQSVYETTFMLKKNGELKEFSINNYPYQDSSWVFVESKTKVIKQGYVPPIHDFNLSTSGGVNLTESILGSAKPVFLLISPKVEEANLNSINKMIELQMQCNELGYPFYLVTSSVDQSIQSFETKTGAGMDVLKADETLLKTITRANLGLVVLQHGVIIGKWNANFTPTVKEFTNPLSAAIRFQTSKRNYAYLLVILFLSTTFAFAIFKRK